MECYLSSSSLPVVEESHVTSSNRPSAAGKTRRPLVLWRRSFSAIISTGTAAKEQRRRIESGANSVLTVRCGTND